MHDDLDPAAPTTLTAADGTRLEALVASPSAPHASAPRAVAAVAHPHPQFGGDMRNNVVAAVCRGLSAAGVATVRYNFRGVGASTGVHGGGDAERADHEAALAAAAALAPEVPVLSCGYSFGADVALTCTHDRLAAWIVVAPPLRLFPDDRFVAATAAAAVHVLAGTHDQFAPPPVVRAATAGWRHAHVHEVAMADHFFAGATATVTTLVTGIVERLLAG